MRAFVLACLLFISPADAAAPVTTLVATGTFQQLTMNDGAFVMYLDKDGFLNYVGPYQPGTGTRYPLRFTRAIKPGETFRINAQPDGSHLLTVIE